MDSPALMEARARISDADAVLALALHLGLNLSAAQIGSITRRPQSEVGLDLEAARRAVDPTIPVPCPEFAELIGRYRDPTLPIAERAKLLHHARTCPDCGPALDGAYRVDAKLVQEIDALERDLPEEQRQKRLLPAGIGPMVLLLVTSLILVAALVSGTLIAHRELSPSTTPVPLVISRAPAALDGWLLFSTQSGVQGLNIETGESRLLVNETGSQLFALLPSPDHQKFAIVSPQSPAFLEVDDLSYHTLRTWTLGPNDPRMSPVSWLGPDRILAIVMPSGTLSTAPGASKSSLITLNLSTGAKQTLYTGQIDQAIGSPDGTLVALTLPSSGPSGRDTLQLRPVGPDGLGAPLSSIPQAIDGNPVWAWAANSQALYFAANTPSIGTPAASSSETNHQAILRLDRSGNRQIIAALSSGESVNQVDVSPDGGQVAYVLSRGAGENAEQTLWRYDAIRQTSSQILPWSRSVIGHAVWSPGNGSSTMLVYERRLFYLAKDAAGNSQAPLQVPVLVRVAFNGDYQVISNVLGGFNSPFSNAGLTAWLPPDAVKSVDEPRPSPPPIAGLPQGSAPVRSIPEGMRLYPSSTLSPDGRFLVMESGGTSRVVWDTLSSSGRQIPTSFDDPSWLPSGQGILAVDNTPDGSRLTIVASIRPSDPTSPLSQADGVQFDPAGIANDRSRSYALPLMAPDADQIAFFVRDARNQMMSLWLVGWQTEPHVVMSWPVPNDVIAGDAPVANWIDPSTLVIGKPYGWRNGLPQHVALMRLTLTSDGTATTKPVRLLTANVQGGDHGVALENLVPSPDGHYLAWRLRHFGEIDRTRGAFDSINVAPARDISQRVEVARGSPGDGLSWNADSYWLAAAIQGRVALFSPDGTTVTMLSAAGVEADEPCWITPRQLWYQATTQDGGQQMTQTSVR